MSIKFINNICNFSKYLPHILLIMSISIVMLFIAISRYDLLFMASVILVPLIVISIILIVNKQVTCGDDIFSLPISKKTLFKVFLILFFLATAYILGGNNNVICLIFLFGLYAVIILNLLSKELSVSFILFEISITTMLLVIPQLFVSGYFYGDTDLLAHANYAQAISNSSTIPEDVFGPYQLFYLYHILISLTSIVLGSASNSALYFVSTIAVIGSIPFIYLLTNHFTKSPRLGLFASFFYALMPMILQALLVPAPRIMATMAFFIVLYLLFVIGNKHPIPTIILSIIVVTYMTGVHHAQLPLILLVMVLICLGSIIYFRKITIGSKPVLIVFTILPLVYLFYSYLISLVSIIDKRLFQQIETEMVGTTVLSDKIFEYDLSPILTGLTSSILIVFIFSGLYFLLQESHINKKINVFIPIIFFTFIFFVPLVMDIFPTVAESFQLYRLRVILTPFFAITMAIGVSVLLNTPKDRLWKRLSTILIIILCLCFVFSSAIISSSRSNDIFYQSDILDPQENYFYEEDISMFSVISKHIPMGSALSTNREYPRYFRGGISIVKYGLPFYSSQSMLALFTDLSTNNEEYKYVIFPRERYEKVGLSIYERSGDYVENEYKKVYPLETEDIFMKNIYSYALIYNNKADIIYTY